MIRTRQPLQQGIPVECDIGNGQVVGTMVYTDGGPENYSVNMIGVMMEIKL